MPMQEFLASYAVQVDEDGARRLQAILDQNRSSAEELAGAFSAAREALDTLKRDLSDSAGMKNIFSGLLSGSIGLPPVSSLSGGSGLSGSAPGSAGLSMSASSILSVGADLSAAETALEDFRTRLESERPRLSVNASGISSAVSSAVASIRSQMSSLRITVPVSAVATMDSSNLKAGSGSGGSVSSASGSGGSGYSINYGSGNTVARFGTGGRVASPTLAMIAEEGEPEYVIPTDNDARAVELIRGLLSELSASAKKSLLAGFSASAKNSLLAGLPAAEAPAAGLPVAKAPAAGISANPKEASSVLPGLRDTPEAMSLSSLRSELRNASSETLSGLRSALSGPANPVRLSLDPAPAGSSSASLSALQAEQLAASANALSGLQASLSGRMDSAGLSAVLSAFGSELRSALSDLSSAAKASFLSSAASGGTSVRSVQAPVNIHVSSAAAAPEAVARSVYDTAQRSLLKTLKGVFV